MPSYKLASLGLSRAVSFLALMALGPVELVEEKNNTVCRAGSGGCGGAKRDRAGDAISAGRAYMGSDTDYSSFGMME